MGFTAKQIIEKRKVLWDKFHDINKDKDYIDSTCNYLMDETKGKELRNEVVTSPELLIEMVFVIVDKRLKTVPFFFNAVQKAFCEKLKQALEDYKTGKRLDLKFIILKGRQQGFTSWISAYQLALNITRKNFSGMTLADSSENTETIFQEKGKFIYDRLPASLQPTEKFNTRRELFFERLNSKWRVATAGNKDIGRSKMLSFFHGSEAGLWSSIREILNGLGRALVQSSIQILESTAKGINEFKDLWDEDNNWENCFFEWWLTPEYSRNFEDKTREDWFTEKVIKARERTWKNSNDETWVFYRVKLLIDTGKINLNQGYWYYREWKDIKGDIRQEFPCFADEAFIASGECVYNNVEEIVQHIETLEIYQRKNKPLVGYFEVTYKDPEANYKIINYRWVNDVLGCITIYEESDNRTPYVIGGDTKGAGAGIVKNRDYYTASVKNNYTGVRCATLHSNCMLPNEYAAQMYCLGKYYNTALVAIEVNIDQYPIKKLQELGYSNQYVRRIEDVYTGDIKRSFGWRTDQNNRPKIISRHIVLVNQCLDLFTSIAMLKEMLSFIRTDIRYDHQVGRHDDLIFADMIAEEVSKDYNHELKEIPTKKTERLIDQLKRDNRYFDKRVY